MSKGCLKAQNKGLYLGTKLIKNVSPYKLGRSPENRTTIAHTNTQNHYLRLSDIYCLN
jgi:hypothetical protein